MTKPNKSAVVTAAIRLLEARADNMVTAEEWQNLAAAVESETGEQVEWRMGDELKDRNSGG